jgi:hypothetical protein
MLMSITWVGYCQRRAKPVFSSAQHYVNEQEWSFWTGKNPDLSKLRMDDKTKSDFVQLAQKTFGTMEKDFKRVAPGTSLIDGVVMQAAPGHPGDIPLYEFNRTNKSSFTFLIWLIIP